jgi:uncharacterized protein (DUF1800 family)
MWSPYVPDPEAPWNLRRVVHLHRRAGFAATWDELQRDLREGPELSITRLLEGRASAHTPADGASTVALLTEAATFRGDIGRLKAAWLFRMLRGADPITERLTLFWHNHFATGYAKVRDAGAMARQNELFRRHVRAFFAGVLHGAVRDPALMLYLDAHINRRGRPNENLARELLELFTVGVGHFSEDDVKESARALTGWTVRNGQFAEMPSLHDDGEKTILARRGRWTGNDLVRIVLEHPATSVRLATKLCGLFFGDAAAPADAVMALAAGLRERELEVGWAVETILRSRRFFAAGNLGNRVLGPVEFIVGAARALELFDPAPSTLDLAAWSARMGQDLFDPPNVGGWPGGRDWITPRSMILRANFATALLDGSITPQGRAYEPAELARRHGARGDTASVIAFHHRLLFGTDITPQWRERLASLGARQAVSALLASPEGQLG